MASTFFGLGIASSGLNGAQVAINTTAHNVSNSMTKGYTRQVANVVAGEALRVNASYGMVGSGVTAKSIDQIRDSYYDQKYWNNSGSSGEFTSKNYYMEQVQHYFNEMNTPGFTTYYDDFFNALDHLSGTPSDITKRNQVIQYGQSFAEYYNNISTNLNKLQEDTNAQVKIMVDRINSLASGIASLNKQISTLEMNKGTANDLRDQRALLVDELSSIASIKVVEKQSDTGSSSFDIKINGQNLVYGFSYNELAVVPRTSDNKRNSTDVEGLYNIEWANGMTFDMYHKELSGELKGLIDIRDGSNGVAPAHDADGKTLEYKGIPYYVSRIDDFMSGFATEFNKLHVQGQDLEGNATTEVPFFTVNNMTIDEIKTEIVGKFDADGKPYTIVSYIKENITARNICVNPELIKDNTKMATAYSSKDGTEVGADEQNLAIDLAELKKVKMFIGGTASEYMQSIITVMSINTQAAASMETNHSNIGKAIINQRLSVSGVDKDEEAMDLVKF
ncbi:MAG: flagellar hook-associated protein FlgK, partial [Clostridiales bacterium]|nr:flagellar hook-associated protein FlgK [Clostridiales bacterium]